MQVDNPSLRKFRCVAEPMQLHRLDDHILGKVAARNETTGKHREFLSPPFPRSLQLWRNRIVPIELGLPQMLEQDLDRHDCWGIPAQNVIRSGDVVNESSFGEYFHVR